MKTVHPFYRSSLWTKKRDRILRRDNYECRQCKRFGRCTAATTVHHIYPLETHPQYKLLSENLLSLCNKCHNQMHDRITNELTEKGIQWKERTNIPPTF
ncbi:HNH endonuclease [Sutcliffiella horikoshii]|uniref:Putative HNH nuclease YajD n=1 Tax=Sutcliffiella horikoshii TaxID=79883 RepID=A0A5D4T3D4_9BACI|nr:HNH endonuclease [Sutcliffiella horikoshii]TYS68666.1 HNH endonuclease [Sutcliffiella horikoshii]